MVESRVDENSRIVPSARLDTDSLVDQRVLREVLVGDGNSY